MQSKWFKSNPKCVIICGGRGTRLDPHTTDKAKSMIEIKGKPIIDYVIDYWKQFASDFVFILGYRALDIKEHVSNMSINCEFVIEQGAPNGIAKALLLAEQFASKNFIVVLGDCLCSGKFSFPVDFVHGVGVWETENDEDIKRSYSVECSDNKIEKVIEKPQLLVNRLCGLGFYFFNGAVFEYINKTPQSLRTSNIELTDVIQKMIDEGELISPIKLEGKYLNVTYPEDLKRAEDIV